MATLRVLRTAKATLTKTFYLDEVGTDATGAVTVAITRLDGTAVENGTATGPVANVYSYTFGGRDVLDDLIATWTATVSGDAIVLDQDVIQVVGGFLFSLGEGRASDSVLADTTKYPTSELIEKRIIVEDECERLCHQIWVPRFRRRILHGTGTPVQPTPDKPLRKVRAVSVAWRYGDTPSVLDAGELNRVAPVDAGYLKLTMGYWPLATNNVIAEYEAGNDRPPPSVVRAAKIHFKALLLQKNSALPDRAERIVVTDMGTVLLSTPGDDSTGIPEVDAAYHRYSTGAFG